MRRIDVDDRSLLMAVDAPWRPTYIADRNGLFNSVVVILRRYRARFLAGDK